MSIFDKYRHLLSRPYVDGRWDCYGLAVDYYRSVFGVELTNLARPIEWWNMKEFDLINEFVSTNGWKNIGLNIRRLKLGDGLIFACAGGKANHIGIYVGNGMFIHHFFRQFSREEPLLDKWTSRLTAIVRHPKVDEIRELNVVQVDIVDTMPDHVKRRLQIKTY